MLLLIQDRSHLWELPRCEWGALWLWAGLGPVLEPGEGAGSLVLGLSQVQRNVPLPRSAGKAVSLWVLSQVLLSVTWPPPDDSLQHVDEIRALSTGLGGSGMPQGVPLWEAPDDSAVPVLSCLCYLPVVYMATLYKGPMCHTVSFFICQESRKIQTTELSPNGGWGFSHLLVLMLQ